MTIHHQIVTDTEGRPVVAQIPGEEFEPVRDRLDEVDIPDPWREEIADRAREIDEGKVELVDGGFPATIADHLRMRPFRQRWPRRVEPRA